MFVGNIRVALLAASQIIPNGSWVATERHGGLASAGKHTLDANTVRSPTRSARPMTPTMW